MDFNDPFDNPFPDNNEPRRPGRPRVRPVREKGPIGRPRIRPLQQKTGRGPGRPRVTPADIGDKIQREALISGSLVSKGVASSVKGLQKSVDALQNKVITPLGKVVNQFSNSVTRFNNYHQQYLKDQVAIAKELNETFKLFRKTAIDPTLRTLIRSQKGVNLVSKAFEGVGARAGANANSDFGRMASSLDDLNKKLTYASRMGVVGVEATDTFLKEYYKTSKGTSKFLNAVTFAAQDISEDISNLRTDLDKYLKRNTKSVVVDQTELLRKIENNTKAPSIGKRMLSSLFSSGVAFVKTAFKYNRFGTTELLSNLFNIDMHNNRGARESSQTADRPNKLGQALQGAGSALGKTRVGKFFGQKGGALAKWWEETVDLEIRRYIRDQENNLQFAIRNASTGTYGQGAAKVADTAIGVGRKAKKGVNAMAQSLQELPTKIVDAWNESKTKQYAKWFMEVGATLFLNTWDRAGAYGERHVNATITNYGKKNYRGPHGGSHTTGDPIVDAQNALNRASQALGGEVIPFKAKAEEANPSTSMYWGNVSKRTTQDKDNIIAATFGKGYGTVSLAADSESTISSGNVSTPQKAMASLLKVNARIMGYMKKLWGKVRTPESDIKESKGGLGGLAGLLGAGGIAGLLMKNRKLLRKGGPLALLAPLLFGGARVGAGFLGKAGIKGAGLRGAGATGRVLWDTFSLFGNAAAKQGGTGMKALGLFKNTKLGQSGLGTLIRQARLASAGYGVGKGSRLARGAIELGKWGGLNPLGYLGGALGVIKGKASPILGAAGEIAKGGTRTAQVLKNTQAAERAARLAKVVESIQGIPKAAGNVVGGIGKFMAKTPAKNKVIGGVLGGVGAKLLMKAGGKGAAKAILKQIPVLGALAGIGFGIWRFTKGQILDGLMEIASGLLTLVPSGWGNAAALGLDATLLARDLGRAKNKNISEKQKGDLLKTFGVKGQGSAENFVSSSQGGTSSMAPGGTNYSKPATIGQRIGTAFSNVATGASKVAAGVATGAANLYKDITGSINWGTSKHDRMHPNFMAKFGPAADEMYKQTGKKVKVTSAIRTNEDQAKLWVRGNILKEPGIFTPALPAYDADVVVHGKRYHVKGSGQTLRTGHLVGGAVDVANYRDFLPYAKKYGLNWMGNSDPVHFQINDRLPVISSSTSQTPKNVASSNTSSGSSTKVGDPPNTSGGGSYGAGGSPSQGVGTGNAGPGPAASNKVSVSPMVQDYGIAIINNLLF